MWILHESVGKPRGNVHLTEAGIGDMFKKAGNWLKTKAGNLTNKVTADKLQQAWTKAGSPTDSGQVASIMVQAGVPQDSIDQIFKNMGLPAGSSTPAPAPAAAPAGPKQGLLGKAAGAVGGAIGGVKGAIAGAKDAFAQGKEQGFDSSRANQAGDAVGATGEANPYAKGAQAPEAGAAQPAPAAQGGAAQPTGGAPAAQGQAGGKAAPAAQGQAAPAAQGGTQQAGGTQAPAAAPAGQEPPPEENKPGIGDKVAGFIKDAEGAMKAGVGMGTTGQSLMQTGTPAKGEKEKPADAVTIKDAQGIEHSYKKVGQQWFDKDNKPVNAAQAAMLDKQAQQQAAMGKEKAPAEPTTTTLANPKDPKTGKPIDPKAQAGQAAPAAPAGQAAPAAAKPAPNYDPQTGKASPEQAKQDAQSRVWMIQQGIDPDNPMQDIPDDQIQARVDAEQKKQAAGQTAPAAAAPAAGQSPEEIRKAKQATAAKTAQDQMAANPAPAKAAPAVWKNNRAPAGTPASTSPQAAAATAQATPAAAQPAAKAHTGGKVAGQVSMTPGAIKKRDARAAAKAAPNDVMARMAKQLAPAEKPAAPNFGQQQTGYASVKTNAPTGVPQVGGPQPTTGAKAVPAQQPAATPAAAPAQSKQDQIDADAHAWFNQKQKARNQAEVSFDDWKQNYKGKPQGPAVPAPQGVETPAAPNFGTPPAPTATPAAPTASAQADANKPGFLQSKIKGSQVPAKQPEMAGTDFSAMLARKAKVRL
jgi:hypothetical protein